MRALSGTIYISNLWLGKNIASNGELDESLITNKKWESAERYYLMGES